VDTEQRCKHPAKHPYRSAEDCRSLESLKDGIWTFSLDFLKSGRSKKGTFATNRGSYRRVLQYGERLENLLASRDKALNVVSKFVNTMPVLSSDAATQGEQTTDEHRGQVAARGHLSEMLRSYLDVLSQDRLEKPPALDPEQEASPDECRPAIEHIEQLENLLRAGDKSLEIVSEFVGERPALQREQFAVVTSANPRSDRKKRELQGRIDARKDLSEQLRLIG
jgi:hypothetical protein